MCRGSMTAFDRAVRSRARLVSAAFLVTALVAAIGIPRPLSAHPLDALSTAEIGAAISVLRAAGHADAATRFPLITLAEPDIISKLKLDMVTKKFAKAAKLTGGAKPAAPHAPVSDKTRTHTV